MPTHITTGMTKTITTVNAETVGQRGAQRARTPQATTSNVAESASQTAGRRTTNRPNSPLIAAARNDGVTVNSKRRGMTGVSCGASTPEL